MDTILVTGGAGFIGSNFVRLALNETPDRIVVVDKLTYSGHRASLADCERDARFAFVEADIADAAAMKAVFGTHHPRAVLNFAAETHVDRSIDGPGAFIHTNVTGTYVLLEAAPAAHRVPAGRAGATASGSCTSRRTRSTGRSGRTASSPRTRPTPRTRRTRRPRRLRTTSCAPGARRTACRLS